MTTALFFIIVFFKVSSAFALETVTAFDDGFAVPSVNGVIEASMLYPGAESLMNGGFAVCGWSVPFGIEDLAVTSFHAGMNFGRASLSLSFNTSGFDLYGEEQEKLGLSISPYKGISAGVRITRNAMHIKGFGHAAAFSADMGVVLQPLETVCIAASFEDIADAELGESHEPLDGLTRFAASWSASEQITLLCSLTKVKRFNPSFSGGFTTKIMNTLTIGVVGGNEPDHFDFLGTVTVSSIHFSYRGSHHRDLGMSHGFSISWGYGRLFE